jgi:hypothetical protein
VSCTCGKVAFVSPGEAREYARGGYRRGSNAGASTPQKPYRCPGDTGLWHLTSKRRSKNKRRLRT